jgi:hypothetical protein
MCFTVCLQKEQGRLVNSIFDDILVLSLLPEKDSVELNDELISAEWLKGPKNSIIGQKFSRVTR